MKLHQIERESIRGFLESCGGLFKGDVLDWGCGQQPYRDIVEAYGTYHGYDRIDYPGNVSIVDVSPDHTFPFDVVLCTQVIQYVPDPAGLLGFLLDALRVGGVLIATGPTNWPHVESADKWRHTTTGIQQLLVEAGFRNPRVEGRGEFEMLSCKWELGWEAVASK